MIPDEACLHSVMFWVQFEIPKGSQLFKFQQSIQNVWAEKRGC